MKKIVCLSTSNWYPFPTRKQHVMLRLTGFEILYFDPSVTLLAPFKDKGCIKRILAFTKRGVKPRENITVYALPPVLPFYNKFRLINRINQFFISLYVKAKMKKHGFDKPILWCYSPASSDAVRHIPKHSLVYDCVDRHSAYKGLINSRTVDRMESELAGNANQVFTTSIGLYDTLVRYNPDTVMLPNGVNFEHFNTAATGGTDIPDDVKNLKHPIVGFSGMLQECIDYSVIEYIAKSRQDWTVLLVGGVSPGVNLNYLKKYPNIHFTGLKKYSEMPAYISCFDVCLNVFKSGSLSRDVSPLKFYEYMASGKPVVSTPQPEQVLGYVDAVYIARGKEDFIAKCEDALSEPDDSKTKLRVAYAKACSWDARVREMILILKEKNVL